MSVVIVLGGVDSVSFVYRYGYMIDNIILLITGTLHQRQISELRKKCHPLGSFEEMESVNIAATPAELYEAVLVDTPLGIWGIVRINAVYTSVLMLRTVPSSDVVSVQ